MNVALLVLRVIVGGLFVGHGSQKLFGWFGGHGPKGTASFFESLGLAPALPFALLAGTAELAGGSLLGFGLFVPVAALLLVGVMTTAIASVHWKNGLWVTAGGLEYPLVLAAVAFAIATLGPGSISLDHAFGIDWDGLKWAAGAAAIGCLGGLIVVALGHFAGRPTRREPQAHTA
ncbi:MAG: DoxX family protein [Xanthobacteraceae bacterium]